MPLPKLTKSKAFYLRQLRFYNLGIHVVTTARHKSVTWTEDTAGRGSSEDMSFLWNFLNTSNNISSRKHFVVWPDSCGGQNKNFEMICFYQLFKLKGIFNVIGYKFFEVGYTYLDSDRDFGRIEKVLRKHGIIFDPNPNTGKFSK